MIRVADSRAARITQAVLSTTVIVNAHLVQCCEEAFCGGIPGAAAQLSGTNIIKDEMRATVKFLVRPRIPSSLSKAQVRREEKSRQVLHLPRRLEVWCSLSNSRRQRWLSADHSPARLSPSCTHVNLSPTACCTHPSQYTSSTHLKRSLYTILTKPNHYSLHTPPHHHYPKLLELAGLRKIENVQYVRNQSGVKLEDS